MAGGCGACGAALSGDEQFCGSCGAAVVVAAPATACPDSQLRSDSARPDTLDDEKTGPRSRQGFLGAWLLIGLVLSFASFVGNLAAIATNRSASEMFMDVLASLQLLSFSMSYQIYSAIPWLTVSLIAALLAGAGSKIIPTSLYPTFLPAVLSGLVTGLVSVALFTMLLNGVYFLVVHLERDALPLAITSLIAGFSVALVAHRWRQTRSAQ